MIALLMLFELALSGPGEAWAFPEMVKNSYPNCATCHYSPNGAGILTEYGRQMSREILSRWSGETESDFAYGLIRPPKWLALQADFRMVESRKSTLTGPQYRFIIMQADAEAAAQYKKFALVGTAGHQAMAQFVPQTEGFVSRRHYVMYSPTDEVSVRGGKFLRTIGIGTAEHTIDTKRGLGFDQNSETYNLELAWQGVAFKAFATGIFGRPQSPELDLEKGASALIGATFGERYQLGMSYYYGTRDLGDRHIFGPWAILGFTTHFFLLSETDFQRALPVSAFPTWGLANYQRLDYEFIQGFHVFGTQEFLQNDLSHKRTFNGAYGIGLQMFPRPHFDIQAYWQRYSQQGGLADFQNWLWLMIHFYL